MTRHFRFCCFLAIVLLLTSCTEKRYRLPLSVRRQEVKVVRYDKEFFETGSIDDRTFRRIYEENILQVGSVDDEQSQAFLRIFRNDSDMCNVYRDCQEIFDAEYQKKFEKQISKAFTRLCFFVEDMPLPQVSFHISGFSQSVVSAPSNLSLALDKFLGSDYPMYEDLFYDYQLPRMSPQRMAADAMNGWIRSEFSEDGLLTSQRVLDYLVYEGKILFLLHKVMPKEPFEHLAGWTYDQLQWCMSNEVNMWERVNAYEQLYMTDHLIRQKYFGEQPSTVYFTEDSPGRAIIWVGYQMVARYMSAHPQVSLLQLMMESDSDTILTESGYHP